MKASSRRYSVQSNRCLGRLQPGPGVGVGETLCTEARWIKMVNRFEEVANDFHGFGPSDIDDVRGALSRLAGSGIAPAYAVLDGVAVIATDPGEIQRLIDVKNGDARDGGVLVEFEGPGKDVLASGSVARSTMRLW